MLAELVGLAFFTSVMVKCANVHLVATTPITRNSLVLVRMVEPLDGGVALRTLDAALTIVPSNTILERLTILGSIFEEVGWATEVPRMVRIDAAL